jgi:hypothetical protein
MGWWISVVLNSSSPRLGYVGENAQPIHGLVNCFLEKKIMEKVFKCTPQGRIVRGRKEHRVARTKTYCIET